ALVLKAFPYSNRPNQTDRHGVNALQIYLSWRSLSNDGSVRSVHLQHMKRMLEFGVDINHGDDSGRTALHYAVYGCPEYVPFLIGQGGNLECKSRGGVTPLQMVIDA